MNLLQGLNSLCTLPPGAVMSIGNYDGVHRGHQRLLEIGRQLRQQVSGTRLVVVTFEPHPLTVLRPGKAPPRLSPPQLKRQLLEEQGVDDLIELAPEPAVLGLTAEQFWRILRDEARPSHLIEGTEFTFGKDRQGTTDRLRQWCAGSGIQLHTPQPVEAALLDCHVVPVSSTLLRWLLQNGRVRDAAICMGRSYSLIGPVIRGHQRGRTIGFPTVNLGCGQQLIPADGVYVARCEVNGREHAAALSIGTLPTFGDSQRQVEAYLLDFAGDLYGQTLRIDLIDWIRDQQKFATIDRLVQQIEADVKQTRQRAGLDPTRPIAAA
jgi:riboflavin kinase / FMN adenylyltransferase